MNSDRINKIYQSIEKLKNDLKAEYEKLQVKYDFLIKNKKIIFSEEIKSYQKSRLKENVFSYIFTANIKNLVSVPFIYSIIFPAIFLDLILTIYQFTAFPLYWIPRVSRKEYFVYDRRFLKYLNLLQKINCLYCSYVNWLFLFSVEIWSRTEQYWCPIKHSTGGYVEGRYANHYADYWDPDKFNEIFNENICFKKK
ncbi:MAG: hypothetical protein ACD_3C00111G0009 [uncultured bacterium (gcode 4)]|uniref:Uncharacterized protein n=1 Tax=uncultured bacterium (gcode 4) TaxID=1234023 RepID=K2G1A5_9BACT|nr:MAG: hypothetical protein ACD_3C00111G0009 [uncultured bacterium (gcode 4)]